MLGEGLRERRGWEACGCGRTGVPRTRPTQKSAKHTIENESTHEFHIDSTNSGLHCISLHTKQSNPPNNRLRVLTLVQLLQPHRRCPLHNLVVSPPHANLLSKEGRLERLGADLCYIVRGAELCGRGEEEVEVAVQHTTADKAEVVVAAVLRERVGRVRKDAVGDGRGEDQRREEPIEVVCELYGGFLV